MSTARRRWESAVELFVNRSIRIAASTSTTAAEVSKSTKTAITPTTITAIY